MLSIIIFNKNYSRFFSRLFKSVSSCQKWSDIRVFFIDDGSSDESAEKARILGHTLNKFHYIQLTPFGNKRLYPSFGQLEGLDYILTKHEEELDDYILFLDSDDWLPDNFIRKFNKYLFSRKYKVIFNKTLNTTEQNNHINTKTYPIIRKIGQFRNRTWPSTSPMSSIVVSKEFLKHNKKRILNYGKEYSNVWLDTRINVLAMNLKPKEVLYSNIPIYRLIHKKNDSLNYGLKRDVLQQTQTSRYLCKYLNGHEEFQFHLKTFLISRDYLLGKTFGFLYIVCARIFRGCLKSLRLKKKILGSDSLA